MAMNKYYRILDKILVAGKTQTNKKGNIQYLLNEQLSLTPADLLDIFEGHNIARKKLRSELQLFMQGERNVEKYREAGINWWDYCGSILVNSYPTYFEKLPPLIAKINREKRNSKNYVFFLGETGAESNQAPCLSLVQFQLDDGGTGSVCLSAQQRREPRAAFRYLPPVPDGTADRTSPEVDHPLPGKCTYLREQYPGYPRTACR